MRFFKLTKAQKDNFESLKTTQAMQYHGPLDQGQEVPVHQHEDVALYAVTQGSAIFKGHRQEVLGAGQNFDAVLLPPHETHGWEALNPSTLIEHVFGQQNVDLALAV